MGPAGWWSSTSTATERAGWPTTCPVGRLGAADVASEDGVDEYLDAAVRRFGRVDLHHLNAGIPGSPEGFPDLDVAEFDRVLAVNVRGMFLGLRGAFRRYREQHTTGTVVLTASIASLRGSADLFAYRGAG